MDVFKIASPVGSWLKLPSRPAAATAGLVFFFGMLGFPDSITPIITVIIYEAGECSSDSDDQQLARSQHTACLLSFFSVPLFPTLSSLLLVLQSVFSLANLFFSVGWGSVWFVIFVWKCENSLRISSVGNAGHTRLRGLKVGIKLQLYLYNMHNIIHAVLTYYFWCISQNKRKNLPGTCSAVHIHMLHIFIMDILGQSASVSWKLRRFGRIATTDEKAKFKFCIRKASDLDIEWNKK